MIACKMCTGSTQPPSRLHGFSPGLNWRCDWPYMRNTFPAIIGYLISRLAGLFGFPLILRTFRPHTNVADGNPLESTFATVRH